jgi:MSHA biogenesis protein MshP
MTGRSFRLNFRQRGVSIVLVLFLLVVVSVLVLSVTRISGTQHMNSAYAFLSAQSYFAARSGLEWGITHVTGGAGCSANETVNAAGYDVVVTCEVAGGPYDEGNPSAAYSMYRITATATGGGLAAPDASNRVVTATIRH